MQNGCSDTSAQRALCGGSVPDTAVQDGGRVGRVQTRCTRHCNPEQRRATVPTLQDLRRITAGEVRLCSPAQGLLGVDSRGTSCHLSIL